MNIAWTASALMSALKCTVTERGGTIGPVMFCGPVRDAERLCFVRLWMEPTARTSHPSTYPLSPLCVSPLTTKFTWFVCQPSHPSTSYSSPAHEFYLPPRVSFCSDLSLDLPAHGLLNLADVQLGRALRG
jgi:hypothetical protein